MDKWLLYGLPKSLEGEGMNEKQEKEIMDYLSNELTRVNPYFMQFLHIVHWTVKAILRRYDVFDTKDMPRGE